MTTKNLLGESKKWFMHDFIHASRDAVGICCHFAKRGLGLEFNEGHTETMPSIAQVLALVPF